MTDVAEFSARLRDVVEAIKQPALAPTGEDGALASTAIEVATTFLGRVLAPLPQVFTGLDDEERRGLASGVQGIASHLYAALLAHQQAELAGRVLEATLAAVPPSQLNTELTAARQEGELFARLVRARWLVRQGERKRGLAQAEVVARQSKDRVLAAAARGLVDVPTPIDRAPSLFTLNGVGTKLYGHADPSPDGTWTATLYLVVLFIPVFPLTRYIVSNAPSGGWYFHAKRRLSRPQILFRRLAVASVLVAALSAQVPSMLSSYGWDARQAIAEARALEATKPDQAAMAYATALRANPDAPASVLEPALDRWVALQPVPDCAKDSGAELGRFLKRVEGFPLKARSTALTTSLDAQVTQCASSLATPGGSGSDGERRRLLAQKELFLLGDRVTHHFQKPLHEAQLALARSWATEGWPLMAMAVALEDPSPEAAAFAGTQFDALGEVGTLLIEERDTIEAFAGRAGPREQSERARRELNAALELEKTSGRQALLESGTLAAVEAQVKRTPGDQQLVTALASLHASKNALDKAQAALAALGPVGVRTVSNQYLGIVLQRLAGHPQEANEALEHFIERNVPRYVAARADFQTNARALQERAFANLRSGQVPGEVNRKLTEAGKDEAKQDEVVGEYLRSQLGADAALAKKRDRLDRLSAVVEAATSWGTVLLGRGAKLEGEARKAVLTEAERVFLSVRGDAEDSPAFKLGYGQVLHRLGRPEEGDAQLQALAKSGGPEVKLQVAEVYRELGLDEAFRTLGQAVFDAHGEFADRAARMLETNARTLEEREKWLNRISKPFAVDLADRSELEGSRLLQQGKYAAASAAFQKAAAFFAKDAATNPVSANNASVALRQAISASFDPAVWQQAQRLQRSALASQPDNTVVMINTIDELIENAQLQLVLERTHLRAPELGISEAQVAFAALLAGPKRSELRQAYAQHPDLKRALELLEQHHALAPQSANGWLSHVGVLIALGDTPGVMALARRAARAGLDVPATAPASPEERAKAFGAIEHHLERLAGVKGDRDVVQVVSCALSLRTALGSALQKQAVDRCRAVSSWKEVDPRLVVATALSRQAIATVAQAQPALKKALDAHPEHPDSHVSWQLAQSDAAVAEAFASDPSMKEAAAMLREVPEPPRWAWVVGSLARDEATRKYVLEHLEVDQLAVQEYFDRVTHDDDVELDAAINAAMFPVLPAVLKPDWVP